MTLDLEKWLSRKLGAVILFTVLSWQLPDYGNLYIMLAKILAVGGVTIVYLIMQCIQNIVEIKVLKINPETEENGNGKTESKTAG